MLATDLGLLEAATSIWRAAAATCVESRQAVLCMLPDVLNFQALPAAWGDKKRAGCCTNRADFPSYILRFNGAEDVILFHANYTNLKAVIGMAKTSTMGVGHEHESLFSNARHVASCPGPCCGADELSATIAATNTASAPAMTPLLALRMTAAGSSCCRSLWPCSRGCERSTWLTPTAQLSCPSTGAR